MQLHGVALQRVLKNYSLICDNILFTNFFLILLVVIPLTNEAPNTVLITPEAEHVSGDPLNGRHLNVCVSLVSCCVLIHACD